MRSFIIAFIICFVACKAFSQITPDEADKRIAEASAKAAILSALATTNTLSEYKAHVINTNFNIPLVRFNFLTEDEKKLQNKIGNAAFFNSVGAGVGYSWGNMTELKDASNKIINTDMENIFGVQTGFLFAADNSNSNNVNIFAMTLGLTILNFQFGAGYELGTIGPNEKRTFLSLSYGIPISKVIKGSSFIINRTEKTTGDKNKSLFF